MANSNNSEIRNNLPYDDVAYLELMNSLYHTYPRIEPPVVSYYNWKSLFDKFKSETLKNLILLDQNKHGFYLKDMLMSFENDLNKIESFKDDIDKLYLEYNTNEKDAISLSDSKNPIHIAIHHDVYKDGDALLNSEIATLLDLQITFYNFHFGQVIMNSIKFLNELLAQTINSVPISEINSNSPNYNKDTNDNSSQNLQVENIQNYTINYVNYRQFLKDLEYNYPIYNAPFQDYHTWVSSLDDLKKEILDNFIFLNNDSKISYLNRMKFEFEEKLLMYPNTAHEKKYAYTSLEDLNNLYTKYGTNEANLFSMRDYKNELHYAIYSNPPRDREMMEDPNAEIVYKMQEVFYNYHWGNTFKQAIDFINLKIEELSPNVIIETPKTKNIQVNKIITTKPQQPKNLKSFNYLIDTDKLKNLESLFEFLKEKQLVVKTSKIDFNKVFLNSYDPAIITWNGTISELHYFIKQLHNHSGKLEKTKQKIWVITLQHFKMADDTELSLKTLRTQKKPANTSFIDKAIDLL